MDGVVADFDKKWEAMFGYFKDPDLITPHGFYIDLELIDGAYDAIERLAQHFDVYFLSTPEWRNPSSWTDKRLWIEQHFGDLGRKRLILSSNKSLLRGHYLIDDRTVNGVAEFDGEHIHFGTEVFPDWEAVLAYLELAEGIRL